MMYRVELVRTEQAFMDVEAESPCQAVSIARHVAMYKKLSWESKGEAYVRDAEEIENS